MVHHDDSSRPQFPRFDEGPHQPQFHVRSMTSYLASSQAERVALRRHLSSVSSVRFLSFPSKNVNDPSSASMPARFHTSPYVQTPLRTASSKKSMTLSGSTMRSGDCKGLSSGKSGL